MRRISHYTMLLLLQKAFHLCLILPKSIQAGKLEITNEENTMHYKSGESSKERSQTEAVRAALKTFVDSLNEGSEMDKGDHPDSLRRSLSNQNQTVVGQIMDLLNSLGLGEEDTPIDLTSKISEPELSGTYKYESLMWTERNLKGRSTLDLEAFDKALEFASEYNCGLGFTATLFDENAQEIYHKDVGTYYNPMPDGNTWDSSGYGNKTEGWTGDTTMTPFSNIKGVAASTYLAAVVDAGLGYLDEPIYLTLDYLSKNNSVGKITPRMILSHTTGLINGDRSNPSTDPYYTCKYDETTTLGECLEKHMLFDGNLQNPPGSLQLYNNEPFDILAELAVKKTGIESYGEIFRRFITGPLGMDNTTYDCPFLRSTNEKPHVAWGSCTTGNDFAKWVQMISSDGMVSAPDGNDKQILTKYAITQMFSHGGGNAVNDGDWIWNGTLPFIMTRCVGRLYDVSSELGIQDNIPGVPQKIPLNSLVGYGLGTMFMLGNHGHMFVHGGSTGGFWFVSPGRYSGYVAWMGTSTEFGNGYPSVGDALMSFEESSKFQVSKSNVLEETWEDIEMCGGHNVYVDFFEKIGVTSLTEIIPPLCYSTTDGNLRRMTEEVIDPRIDSYRKLIDRRNLFL